MADASFDVPPIPHVIENPSLDDVLEIMTRAVFQAGLSWAQIAKNWNAYRTAFHQFDVAAVAALDEARIDAVLQTPGVMRSLKKATATVKNARALQAVRDEFGSFERYARSFDEYKAVEKDMRKRFAFMGEMNVWYVLFRAHLPVPRFEVWLPTIKGDHPRMREMVALARDAGIATEYEWHPPGVPAG